LQPEIKDFGAAPYFTCLEGQTDFDSILQLAVAYGKSVFADGKTVYVADEISVRNDEVIFEWGKSLISFESEQSIRGLVSDYSCVGWDDAVNESFIGKSALSDLPVKVGGSNDWTKISKGGGGKFSALDSEPHYKDADDAKQYAGGKLLKNSMNFFNASGKAEGNCRLRPGMRVTIKAVGEAFEGEYLADRVRHCFDGRNGYTVEFTLKRNMSP
jgi:phage protein D